MHIITLCASKGYVIGHYLSHSYIISREAYGLETAAFQIICGGVVPMDLATVQLPDGTSTYMAQMICWGLVADIDIESEKFRVIGKTRYVLGITVNFTSLRTSVGCAREVLHAIDLH